MTVRSFRRRGAAALAVALIAASCGSVGDDASNADTTTTALADDSGDRSTESTTGGTTAATDGTVEASAPLDAPVFPVTIEHAFGTTEIEAEPQRVVTFGFADHSYALSLGVVPIGLRKTYDSQPFVVFPWGQPGLGGAEPELIGFAEPSFEQIASLEPDLILGINSNMEQRDYDILSAIAPTVAAPAGFEIQQVPWRETMRITGEALGREAEAEQVIVDLEDRFAAIQAENPSFTESTVSIAFSDSVNGRLGSYGTDNGRYQFLGEMGFSPPPALLDLGDDGTITELGAERIDLLDADVVIWNPTGAGAAPASIRDIPTRLAALPAANEGREVVLDDLIAAALTEASPLSIEYALDRLVPELVAAADGDPATVASSAQVLYADGAPDAPTAEEQAAMDAWEIALGTDAPLEERRPHVEDFEALIPVFDQAIAAGEAQGGVEVTSTSATITDDVAAVTFTARVGEVEAPDLIANLDLVNGVWVARRTELCGFVVFIGVECPLP